MSQPLMGSAEIGRRCGISRQRVHQLTGRPDWPAPLAELSQGRVWRTDDVEAWIKVHRPAWAETPRREFVRRPTAPRL